MSMNRFEVMIKLVDGLQGKKKLGEILMKKYQLTEEELAEALSTQKRDPMLRRLGYILIEKGYITQTEMMEALAGQLDVCVPYGGPEKKDQD